MQRVNEYINSYIGGLINTVNMIDSYMVAEIIDRLGKSRNKRGRIFIFGNGGSSALANHFACDFGKNVHDDDDKRFNIISVSENIASITAYGNDCGYENIFLGQLKNHNLSENDIVFAISSSGNSHNIIKAVEYGKARGCCIVSLTGFSGGKLKPISDICIHIECCEYEKIEDAHSVILHSIVSYYKNLENGIVS